MATPSIDPSFYADFGGLTELKRDVKDRDPNAIRKAAQQFESLFTEMMLKSMREAKLGEGLGESDQTDFYQDMYDQQLSLEISRGKGLGLADMLVQQLTRSGLVHGAGATGAAGTPGTAAHGGSGVRAGAAHELSAPGTKTVKDRERISFIRALTPYAQRAGALLGISPDSLIGQAALETGWGEHIPASADGRSSNNLFGVKAGADFRGASLRARTTEYLGALPATQTQSFRAYSTLQQGINDYVTLLRRQPGYQAALGTGEDVGAFAAGLQRGGYATDPDYVQKLSATVASVRALRAADGAVSLKLQADAPITGETMTGSISGGGSSGGGETSA